MSNSLDIIYKKIGLLELLRKLDDKSLKRLCLNIGYISQSNDNNEDFTRQLAYFIFDNYKNNEITNIINLPYSVFFSYKWEEESQNMVEKLEIIFKENSIKTVRDKRDLEYGGSILDFMKEIGLAKYIIAVISYNYFRSEFCMSELLQVYENKESNHLLPIILSDSMLFDKHISKKHCNFWKNQVKNSLETGEGDTILYTKIMKNIENIIMWIKDIKVEKLEKLNRENFDELVDIIKNNSSKF